MLKLSTFENPPLDCQLFRKEADSYYMYVLTQWCSGVGLNPLNMVVIQIGWDSLVHSMLV